MSHRAHAAALPTEGKIGARAIDADFADAWAVIAAAPELTALGQFLKAVRATPAWAEACMRLRNRAARTIGLKDLGELGDVSPDKAASAYRPGERIGIFTLLDIADDEVLLGDCDKHLGVVLSVSRAAQASGHTLVTIATVVHVHNLLGRLYMLPVAPMHRLIAPAVANAIGR